MKFWGLVGVVWLLVSGSAGAVPFPSYDPGPAMGRWQAIAAERFPGACRPTLGLETPDYLLSDTAYASNLGPCQIVFSARFFEIPQRERRCALVVHEYGHLAGLAHSSDPLSIMYPRPSVLAAKRCLHPRRWD